MRTGRPRIQPLVCTVEGCTDPTSSKGMCRTHYSRFRKYGNADICHRNCLPIEVRFWVSVNKFGPTCKQTGDRCWLWVDAEDKRYGVISVDGKQEYVHRYSYKIHVGEIPDGLEVCHKCDVPKCVNPSHLFLGTRQVNLADMVSKNRHSKGEICNWSILKDAQVRAIRRRYVRGHPVNGQAKLAEEFGVKRITIWKIIKRHTWKHL